MSKKILSFVLILAIMMSTVIFTGIGANAEETVSWKVGDQPFAVEGGRQDPLVMKASDGKFYDDFIIPTGLDFDGFKFSDTALTSSNNLVFQLNQGANNRKNEDHMTVYGNSGTEYIWMYINEEDENGDNPNAYGGKGTSIKITNTSTKGTTRIDRDGKSVYTNAVRTYDTINCSSYPSLNDIAFSFWVKTTGPATFSMAFYVKDVPNNTDFARKLYTDPVNITEAGEYIITFPIQSFYIGGASFPEIDISTLIIQRPEIFFETTSTVDFYIDNFGIYPIMPNFEKATHTAIATVVDDFSDYSLTSSFKVTSTANANYTWEITNGTSYGTLSINDNNGDKSLVYNATTYCDYNTTNYNDFRAPGNNHIYRTEGINGKIISKDDTLAFHIYASRATKLNIQTNDKNGAYWIASPYYVVPAGESILRVPLSDLTGNASANTNLAQIRKIIIKFQCATPRTNTIGGTAGTFEIDDIAIEPTVVEGDVNGDKFCDLIDVFRLGKIAAGIATTKDKTAIDFYADEKIDLRDITILRRRFLGYTDNLKVTPALRTEESFVEKVNFVIDNWKISTNVTPIMKSFKSVENAPFYYTGTNDTKSYEVKYSSLTTTGNRVFYNSGIVTDYGSDSVLSFWVYTDQSVNLWCQYMDYAHDDSKENKKSLTQCVGKTITIPAGESIVEIPMSECVPSNKEMKYETAYQFLISVSSNSASTKTEGTIYVDSIGFYDKDTTNDIGYIPAVTE